MIERAEPRLHVLFSPERIEAAVKRLAGQIGRDYSGKEPLMVAVLKGSFVFLADLVRLLDFPLEVEFIGLSSYEAGTESSGAVRLVGEPRAALEGRHVLVIEDIVDTGLTTRFAMDYLRQRRPASLRLCALLDKPSRRKTSVAIDYLGFSVPDVFIVGYGIDWNERFRNLRSICAMGGEER